MDEDIWGWVGKVFSLANHYLPTAAKQVLRSKLAIDIGPEESSYGSESLRTTECQVDIERILAIGKRMDVSF